MQEAKNVSIQQRLVPFAKANLHSFNTLYELQQNNSSKTSFPTLKIVLTGSSS